MWRAKLRERQVLASTLAGMDVDSATRLARQSGYVVEVITSGMSFDRRMDRIRLFTDGHDIVTRASAGDVAQPGNNTPSTTPDL
jgi:hypothetical protein